MLAPAPSPTGDPLADTFVTALGLYMGGDRTPARLNEVFRLFLVNPRIHRMAGRHEFEFNLKGDRDEIVQGMALIFLDKYLNHLDDPNNVYSLLYSVARNVSLSVKGGLLSHDTRYISLTEPDSRNHHSFRPVDVEVPLGAAQEIVEMASEDFTQSVEQAIDRQRAEEKLAARFLKLDPALQARLDRPLTVYERKVRQPREPSREAKELLFIRDRMRLDNRRFALALGVEHPLLCAYIYGRTKKIRDRVMEQARAMYRNRGDSGVKVIDVLGRRGMRRIVEGWLLLMDERRGQEGFTALGKVLGVNWHTVRRWHGAEFKPPLEKLRQLDETVRKAARRRGAEHGSAELAATSGATGRTSVGKRLPVVPAVTPRGKAVGKRRLTTGQASASRPSAPVGAPKRRTSAASGVTTTTAAAPKAPRATAPAKVTKATPKAKPLPKKAKPAPQKGATKKAKAPVKKAAPKKMVTKKVKVALQKVAPRPVKVSAKPAKKAAKKVLAKATPAKKPAMKKVAHKPAPKKVVAKKTAPVAKKPAPKKVLSKKVAAKKPATK